MGVDRADHVSASVEVEHRAARVGIGSAHPFGLDATRADGFALDVGVDGEHPGDLLEPRAGLLDRRVGLDCGLSPEHLDDRLKLLRRHGHALLIEG